MRKAFGN
jgi:hypothetical protein